MIYTSNLRGSILDVNQAGVDMLGYQTREDLLEMVLPRDFTATLRTEKNLSS